MSLRSRTPLFALLIANTISQIGNVFALVAIPLFVLETTGSAAKTGLTGFFTVLPVVLAGFLGGVVVDRLGHRRASIAADLFSGVAVAMVPFLYVTVGLSLWQLLVLVFLRALLDLPGSTARQSLVPELAERAGVRQACRGFASRPPLYQGPFSARNRDFLCSHGLIHTTA